MGPLSLFHDASKIVHITLRRNHAHKCSVNGGRISLIQSMIIFPVCARGRPGNIQLLCTGAEVSTQGPWGCIQDGHLAQVGAWGACRGSEKGRFLDVGPELHLRAWVQVDRAMVQADTGVCWEP